jgi:leader peptidase (prepilin peptidase)/N-methyltransferase
MAPGEGSPVMTWIRVLLAVLSGLVVGSFLTVVVRRIPAGESVGAPSSRCRSCGAPIRPRDNVPVASWLVLRGRCRSCGARIPARYPLIEIATAGLFAAAALRFHDGWLLVAAAAFLADLLALSLIDLEHKILPNRIVYPSLIVFPAYLVIARVGGAPVGLVDGLIGFLAYGGGMFVVAIISPAGMGMGDVKLAALIGIVVGAIDLPSVAVAAGLAILLGGLGAVAALAMGKGRKSAVPFGPFLAAGAALALFWGPTIADAYLRSVT